MKWLKYLGFLYLLPCIGLYLIQEKVIFHPQALDENHQFRTGQEIEIPIDDALSMNCLLIKKATQKNKKVILYFHGNRGNIRRSIYQMRHAQEFNFDIFIPDYRSFGKTEGQLKSNKQILNDATKAYEYLTQFYSEENIIVIGYSLGTGMASYVSSKFNPAHLVLVAPFTSLTDIKNQYLWMFPNFLLKYKLDNAQHLKNTSFPITIIHGTHDEIVNYKYSKKLKELYPRVNLITRAGVNHRGIILDNTLRKVLSRLI